MIKVTIVEDNATIREGLAALIAGTDGYICSGTYSSCEEMMENLKPGSTDVILMDIGLPGISGIEGIEKVKKLDPEVNILMLTVYEESEMVFNAICSGACGYLVKKTPPARLLEAIKDVADGGSPMSSHIARQVISTFQNIKKSDKTEQESNLTNREKEVLFQLAEGSNYQEIAETLFISVDTVRHHIRNIYRKLHVHSQSQAVAKAIRKKLI